MSDERERLAALERNVARLESAVLDLDKFKAERTNHYGPYRAPTTGPIAGVVRRVRGRGAKK